MNRPIINLVVVGDTRSGKTSLLSSFFKETTVNFNDELPTFDDFVKTSIQVDDQRVAIELRDTVSSEACRRFRLFWYMGAHVVILCFSVDSPESLNRVPDDWMPELRRICPEVPIILVANKLDLRDKSVESEEKFVKTEIGRKMSEKIKATAYLECSALSGNNVKRVFEVATKAALESIEKSNKSRFLLNTLESTKKTLEICMHLLTLNEIGLAIINCHYRGVRVRVICDNEFSTSMGSQIKHLISNGITVKIPIISYHMHLKTAIIDGHKVITGSANWTVLSLCGNWENLMVISQPEIVQETVAAFEEMWNHPNIQIFSV